MARKRRMSPAVPVSPPGAIARTTGGRSPPKRFRSASSETMQYPRPLGNLSVFPMEILLQIVTEDMDIASLANLRRTNKCLKKLVDTEVDKLVWLLTGNRGRYRMLVAALVESKASTPICRDVYNALQDVRCARCGSHRPNLASFVTIFNFCLITGEIICQFCWNYVDRNDYSQLGPWPRDAPKRPKEGPHRHLVTKEIIESRTFVPWTEQHLLKHLKQRGDNPIDEAALARVPHIVSLPVIDRDTGRPAESQGRRLRLYDAQAIEKVFCLPKPDERSCGCIWKGHPSTESMERLATYVCFYAIHTRGNSLQITVKPSSYKINRANPDLGVEPGIVEWDWMTMD